MSIGFEKRKYRSGYYVDISSIHHEKNASPSMSFSRKKQINKNIEFTNISIPVKSIGGNPSTTFKQENTDIYLSFIQ
jgi:hypothetical protein